MHRPIHALPPGAPRSPRRRPAAPTVSFVSRDVLSVSLLQLREWGQEASQRLVACPKSDAESWEDTEIDLRRTVL